ncbi:MAG: BrnT family toxin [bacterium]|nr:BrnT family toxin [bacterium]
MRRMTFSMDDAKDQENQKKHGVAFGEARTVFFDENAVRFFDVDHSEDEDRYLMLGLSARFRILVVSHCYRQEGFDIRLISARKATKNEQTTYRRSKR